jgi:hypothetical protein
MDDPSEGEREGILRVLFASPAAVTPLQEVLGKVVPLTAVHIS